MGETGMGDHQIWFGLLWMTEKNPFSLKDWNAPWIACRFSQGLDEIRKIAQEEISNDQKILQSKESVANKSVAFKVKGGQKIKDHIKSIEQTQIQSASKTLESQKNIISRYESIKLSSGQKIREDIQKTFSCNTEAKIKTYLQLNTCTSMWEIYDKSLSQIL